MATSKTETAAVTTFADHEVIVPPNKLKKAVVRARPDAAAADPVAEAEQALADLSSEFAQWMDNECRRLDAARDQLHALGFVEKTRDEMFRAAHDIKGEATTFGFPLVEPVAESLCRLIEHSPEPSRIPLSLIDQHVDGIKAIVRRNAKGDTEAKSAKLAGRLRQVTDEFLVHENRHRPDYLEGILAPPLAPGE